MGELTIQLDEAVLAELSRLAAAHGRSMEAEVRAMLDQELQAPAPKPLSKQEWLAMAAKARAQTPRLDVQAVDLIREDRDER